MNYTKQQIEQEIIRILEQGTAAVKKVVDAYVARRTPERDMNWLCIQMGKEFGAILLHADLGKAAIRAGLDGRDMDEKFQTIKEEVAHYQGYYNLLNRTIGKDAPIPVEHIYSYVLANVGPNGLEPDGPMLAQKDRWPANFNYIANMGAYAKGKHPWVGRVLSATGEGAAGGWHWAMSQLPPVDDFFKEAAKVQKGIAIDELRHGPQELAGICDDYSPDMGVDLDELFRELRHARYLEVLQRNEQFLYPMSDDEIEAIRQELMNDAIEPIRVYSQAA
jgi:hypothetical protein